MIRAGRARAATPTRRAENYIKAVGKGVVKVMLQDGDLDGAELPRRADLRGHRAERTDVVDEYFTGTASRIGGIGLDVIAEEVQAAARARVPRAAGADGAASIPAGNTSTAATASTTCSTRDDRTSCSTPCRSDELRRLQGVLAR